MDNATPVPPAPNVQPIPPAPINPVPPVSPKRNPLPLVLIILFLCATLITGAVYFFVSSKKVAKGPVPTPKPITAEQTQWKKYTDSKYDYFFYYPETWYLTKPTSDLSQFEFHYSDTAKPGLITGKFLTKAEKDELALCGHVDNKTQFCRSASLSASTTVKMELNIEKNEPKQITALVSRPSQVALFLNITQPNFDSYETLVIMLDTIKFGKEPRTKKIQLCPDSWSADKKSVTYRGITFAAEEIDQDFTKTSDCKK